MSTVSVSGPAQLLAVIPYHLGFQPLRSVVVVALRGTQVDLVARVDIPAPGAREAVVSHLMGPVRRESPTTIALIGYESDVGESMGLLDAFAVAVSRAGLHRLGTFVVRGDRWFGVGCDCCPAEGRPMLRDADVPAIATYVGTGHAVLSGREALGTALTPLAPGDPGHDAVALAVDDWRGRWENATQLARRGAPAPTWLGGPDASAVPRDDGVARRVAPSAWRGWPTGGSLRAEFEALLADGAGDGAGGWPPFVPLGDDELAGLTEDEADALRGQAFDAWLDEVVEVEPFGGPGSEGEHGDDVSGWLLGWSGGPAPVVAPTSATPATSDGGDPTARHHLLDQSLRAWGAVLRGELDEPVLETSLPAIVGPLRDATIRDALIVATCPGGPMTRDCVDERLLEHVEFHLPPAVRRDAGGLGRGGEPGGPGGPGLPGGLDGLEGQRSPVVPHAMLARLEAVVRATPEAHVAPLLSVYASLAWWSGDGARAAVAVEHALRVEPDHYLCTLLAQALEFGLRPQARSA
jgi:hypothetical protein